MEFDRILNFRPVQNCNKYQYLKVIGKVDHKIPFTKKEEFFFAKECLLYDVLSTKSYFTELVTMADHRVVLPTRKNVSVAIRKMDKPLILPEKGETTKVAVAMFDMMVGAYLKAGVGYEKSTINLKAGGGVTYKKHDIKTKEEALKSPLFADRFDRFASPFWENCPKREFLPLDEILASKIRTFKISEVDFLLRQKFLFDQQNEKFKEACTRPEFWGKYGFSKEFGGFHRFINRLCQYPILMSSDISGWDRVLPVLSIVYKIRVKHLLNPPTWTEWVVFHIVHSIEIDEDGFVFVNHQGNRSGQGSTTVDNTLAHMYIIIYILCDIYFDRYGCYPSYSLIRNQGVGLMGDDNLSGYSEEFNFPEFPQLVVAGYLKFGLVVKQAALKVQTRLLTDRVDEFEFLGCTVGYNEKYGRYVPIPRRRKVASTILYAERDSTIDIYAQRIIGLMYISYADEFLSKVLMDVSEEIIARYVTYLPKHVLTQLEYLRYFYTKSLSSIYGFESIDG